MSTYLVLMCCERDDRLYGDIRSVESGGMRTGDMITMKQTVNHGLDVNHHTLAYNSQTYPHPRVLVKYKLTISSNNDHSNVGLDSKEEDGSVNNRVNYWLGQEPELKLAVRIVRVQGTHTVIAECADILVSF